MNDLLEDAEARRRIREDLGTSLLVEAAAGTGKTTELVRRLVAVLRSGVPVQRLAAVTFTDAAAGELKLRLRAELDRARAEEQDPIAKGHLLLALTQLEAAAIGTIHSFCTDLLRERPVEAELDPAFEAIDERAEDALFHRSFSRYIQARLADPPPALLRALRRPGQYQDDPPLTRLEAAARTLQRAQSFDTPWSRPTYDLEAEVRRLSEQALVVAEIAARSSDTKDALRKGLEPLIVWARALRLEEADGPRDPNNLEADLISLKTKLQKITKGYGPYAEGVTRTELFRQLEELKKDLERWKEAADADLAPALRLELAEVLSRHQKEKQRLGKVAFDDLLRFVHSLLRRDPSVRRYFQGQFDRIFVDELQDTDQVQMEIILLLGADDPDADDGFTARTRPGKLFLVGDPKQSIYRFRYAGLGLYERVKQHLAQQDGAAVLFLSRSFRATLPLQAAVNRAFAPRMIEDANRGSSGYVPLLGGVEPSPTQPSLVALPIPDPYGSEDYPNGKRVEAAAPEAVAAFLSWLLLESGYTVRDPEGQGRVPVQARHVAVLLKQFSKFGRDTVAPYAEALEEHGVEHLLVGARSFHQREEIEALRAALSAIERPEDELAVYATLRGPLFGLEDEALFRYRRATGHLRPWRAQTAPEPALKAVDEALGILDVLSQSRNRRPVVETIHALLERTRAPVGLALRQGGQAVLRNVFHLADLARAYELSGGTSFRGFVERVTQEAEDERREGPVFEQAIAGVRLMTVHKAKGLEFPVVVLADPGADLGRRFPSQHFDVAQRLHVTKLMGAAPKELTERSEAERAQEEAEGVRVCYVAATRARDLLVVPVVGTGKDWRGRTWQPSWLSPLDPALYPAQKRIQPEAAVGTPAFGPRSVVREDQRDSTFAPGFYPEPGVTWWDPKVLPKAPPPRRGIQAEAYLAEGGEAHAAGAAQGRGAYAEWRGRRQAALEEGQVLSLVPIRPSDGLPAPSDWNGDLSTVTIVGPREGGAGKRFGSLVHLILAEASLAAETPELETLARLHARSLLAPAHEERGAIGLVQAVLASELWQEARAATAIHREYPVVATTPDGLVLDGVLDLVFEHEGVYTVVDWKTGLLLDASVQAREEAQIAWYAHALSQASGAYVRAILVRLAGA